MRARVWQPRGRAGVDRRDGGTGAAGMETSMNHKILFATVALALASTGTAFAQQPAAAPDKPARHMKLDTNNDGAIHRAEAAATPRLAEHFDKADKHTDGRLAGAETAITPPTHHPAHRGPPH